jgi:predicted PurR-regulated permease PerM
MTAEDAPAPSRNVAVTILAVLACVAVLRYAWQVLLPIMIAILASYALDPVVKWLGRLKIPPALAAAVVILSLSGGMIYGVFALSDDALAIAASLPDSAKKLRASWRRLRGSDGPVQTLTEAVTEIEKTADAAPSTAAPPPPGVTRVQVEEKPFSLKPYLWWGSLGVAGLVGQAVVIAFLAYALLASGDFYRRKLVSLAGPTLSRMRVTVQILDDITSQIERFLFVQLLTSVVVAVASAVAFSWMGLERAVFWGLLAGIFNSIPYFGPLIVLAAVSAVAYVQFGTIQDAGKIGAVSFLITGLEGYALTPWLLGKHLRMNGVAVFIGLLFWGWVWGVWGMLLAMPMMVVLKAIGDHVEDLKVLGELLGE